MSNSTVTTKYILTSNYIRYNRLSDLIATAFYNSKATSINLYIDLYSMVKTLFSDTYRTDISDYTAMTSAIINMCGHYRSFFKGINVYTKIYLIFSYNTMDLYRKLVPDYNSTFYGKSQNQLIRKMVESNNELLEVLCQLIYDVYFLKTEFEPSTMIDYLILHGDGNPNLILSKDIYPSQLTYLHTNTAYLKPKKLYGEDISVIIPPNENIAYSDSFWNVYCNRENKLARKNITIHPCNFTLLSALNRLPERNLKTILHIQMANKLISDVVGDSPVKLSADSMAKFSDTNGIPMSIVENRQHALDVEFFRELYNNSVESKTIKLDNLNDPATLNTICADAFREDPIDLSRL